MRKTFFLVLCLALMACTDSGDVTESDTLSEQDMEESSSEQDGEACVPACPEGENTLIASDIPCGEDDGDPETLENSCMEVESCGEVIYCRATGV